jgi:hypothetical protein
VARGGAEGAEECRMEKDGRSIVARGGAEGAEECRVEKDGRSIVARGGAEGAEGMRGGKGWSLDCCARRRRGRGGIRDDAGCLHPQLIL